MINIVWCLAADVETSILTDLVGAKESTMSSSYLADNLGADVSTGYILVLYVARSSNEMEVLQRRHNMRMWSGS